MGCFTYSFHMPLLFCRNVSAYVLKQLIKFEWPITIRLTE